MKIIKPGDATKSVLWWHGQYVVCGNCSQQYKLEAADENLACWISTKAMAVEFQCQLCRGIVVLQKYPLGELPQPTAPAPVCDCNARNGGIARIDCPVHGLRGT